MNLPRLTTALAAALFLAPAAPALRAAALSWDSVTSNGATIDAGSGNWTLSDPNWNNSTSNEPWSQTSTTSSTNSATFAGTDGTANQYVVTLPSQMAVQGLTFSSSGYQLTGGALFLGNTTTTNYGITVAAGKTATINSPVVAVVGAMAVNTNNGTLNLGGGFSTANYTFSGAGTLNLTGGNISTSGFMVFNNAVTNHSAGTVNLSGTSLSNIGNANNLNTTYTVSGTGVLNATTPAVLGRTGNTSVNLATLIVKDGGTMNVGTASSARFTIVGGASTNVGSNATLDIQAGGTLTIGSSNATFNTLALFGQGSVANRVATFKVSGGNATVNGVAIGGTGTYDPLSTARIELSAGNLYIGSANMTRATVANGINTEINLLGGTLGASADWTSALNMKLGNGSGATIQAAGAAGTARTITLSGNLSDHTSLGNLTKTGNGTLILSGTNTYTGATLVNAGVLTFARRAAKASGTVTATATGSVGFGLHDTDPAYYSASDIATVFNAGSPEGFTLDAASGIAINVDSTTGTANQTVTLTGSRPLLKTGTGNLTFATANTYSGLTTVSAGELAVLDAGALGTTAGGTRVEDTARLGLYGNITISGEAITIIGSGGTGANGALQGRSGSSKWTGNVTLGATGARIGAAGNATLEVSGVIDDGGLAFGAIFRPVDVTGTTIVSGNNTYSGSTTLAGGLVQMSSFNSVVGGTASSSFGAPTTVPNGLIFFGINASDGNLRYVGTGETTDRTIQIGVGTTSVGTGGASIEQNGSSGALVFSAPAFNTPQIGVNATAVRVLTLKGSNTQANTISGVIADNLSGGNGTAVVALTKDGTGTWILGGNNTYTGPTNVILGTLGLGGSQASGISLAAGTTLQLDVTKPVTSSSTLTFSGNNTVKIVGTPLSGNTTLFTAASISGTPTLSDPIEGLTLLVDSTTITINYVGASDTTAPAAPTIALLAASDTGSSGSDLITNSTTPTVVVTLNGAGATAPLAGDVVKLFDGATQVASATLSAGNISTGSINLTTSVLAPGNRSLTATVTDTASVPNVSLASNTLAVTLDTTAPIITVTSPGSNSAAWGATYTDAGATADDSSTVVPTGTVNTAKPGVYPVTYNATDVAGNPATPAIRNVTVSIANPTTVGADGLSPLMKYALGANSPSDTVQAPVLSGTSTTLVLTAVVRTDDPKLNVVGTTRPDLATGTWTTTGVSGSPAGSGTVGDQTGVITGQRRVYTVTTGSRTFLRLEATLAP